MNKRKIRILMKRGIKLGGGQLQGAEDPGGERGKVRGEWEQNLSSALLPRLQFPGLEILEKAAQTSPRPPPPDTRSQVSITS